MRTSFPANQLTLEITEGIFIDDLQYLIPVLHKIRDLGVKLSMDDFGTGYSSLSLLKQLPVDELKIDKSFIDNITTRNEDRLMVSEYYRHRAEPRYQGGRRRYRTGRASQAATRSRL